MVNQRQRKWTRAQRGSSPTHRAQWRSTYEETAYDQLPWFEPGPSPPIRFAVAEGFLPKGGDVLDVGCGAGSNVLFLAKRGYRAHGIDLSPGAVAAARARAAKAGLVADVQEGDALALPFAKGGLDGMLDHGCFHTLPISRRGDYAREAHRVLRPGGSFVLCWVAREATGRMGPPHRPSLHEVTETFESRFLFTRTGYLLGREEGEPPTYFGFLSRRSEPQPPVR
ncbi:MAG: class I SAM-dependent methyltransferase [Thermoplasmata archaeon]